MKIIYTILLLAISLQLLAQSYPITGITISLPANPDATTIKWATASSLLTITANGKLVNGRPDTRVEASKILVTIKKGGTKVCGSYNSLSAPSANFTSATKVWSGNNAVSLLGQECTLPAGDYELCAQFFADGITGLAAVSEEKCKAFTIKPNLEMNYQAPQNILPSEGEIFNTSMASAPVLFRWSSVIPNPGEPVTYRLKVWQVSQGQTVLKSFFCPSL
jgi:hypothetical protein